MGKTDSAEYDLHTFQNGIRLVHKQVPHTKIAHCGFVLDIGSRDEKEGEGGIAHFWEHMAFKGTKKRRAFHILNRVDSVGGELNAYTTKEKICFYASILANHFEKSVELLTDITFHSTFPEKEIIKEKGVILEEMSMYEDDPADAISDEFDEVIFGNHPLGKNILGNRETVSKFNQDDFFQFIKTNLNTERVVFSAVTPFPFEKVLKVVGKYLADIPKQSNPQNRLRFTNFQTQTIQKEKSISQAHCAIGSVSLSFYDEQRIPFFLLSNLLGGPGMNSRLNLAIREKYGFVYGIDANYTSYLDTGSFAIFFATESKTLERCIQLVMKELKKLQEVKLGKMQLHQAKQQLMGQMAMGDESNLSLMLVMGKSIIDLEKVESLNSIFEKIRNTTAEQLLDLANQYLAKDKLSFLTYLPA